MCRLEFENIMNSKKIKLITISVTMVLNTQMALAEDLITDFGGLKDALKNATGPSVTLKLGSDILATAPIKTGKNTPKSVTILGEGKKYRSNTLAFDVQHNTKLELNNITLEDIQHGSSWGGAMYNEGTLILDNVTFNNNIAKTPKAVGGGAMALVATRKNPVSTTIKNSTFTNNSTVSNPNYENNGGAIYVYGTYGQVGNNTLKISDSHFESNHTNKTGGAIGVNNLGPSVFEIEIKDTTFTKNNSTGYGGAIDVTTGGTGNVTLNLDNATFNGNKSKSAGGAIAYEKGNITSNIINSTFTNNTANNGGAIYNGIKNLEISNTIFDGNKTNDGGKGGAIFNGVEGTINFQTETDKDINFVENVANGQGNDIFNEGTINIKGNGKINVTGGIAGISGAIISNNGSILNLGGANEKYIGEFVQNSGTTNVTGSFFGGKSEIAGVLNWLTDTDIAEGAMMTFNGGNLNVGNGVNSAKLTIKGDSTLAGASTVEVKNNAELTFAKEAEIGTISGVGTIGVENSVLTFSNSSEISDTLKFYSNDGTANLVGTSDLKTSSLLNQILGGSNNNLKISLNNVNVSSELFVDGAQISSVLTKNNVTLNSKLLGTGSFINEGNLSVNADMSGFAGLYKQITGTTTIDSSENMFRGSKIVENGEMTVLSGFVGYNDVSLSSGTTFKQIITDDTVGIVGSDTIKFLGAGATARFESNGVVGNILLGKIDCLEANTVSFVGSKVSLNDNNYQGNTVYEFVDSEIDLIEKTTSNQINNYILDNIKSENSSLSFNVHINRNDSGNTISTDTLTVNSSELQKFNINNIYITGEENGQRGDYFTVEDVLKGNAEFNPNQSPNIMGATTSWSYKISLDGLQTIKMSIENYTDENTLKTMNNLSGSRFFHFSEGDSNVYYIGSPLGETTEGAFSVKGYNNVISGKIIDSLGSFTGEKGSFFDVLNSTNLTVSNLTLQDAHKVGNGSVANITNENAEVSFVNSTISQNSSTEKGGAVYNENGNVNLENSSFVSNSAKIGGAIFNATNSVINIFATNTNSVIFKNNTANGVANDIYNEGTLNLLAAKNSSIVFNDGISGNALNKGKINIGELNFGNVIFNNTVANQDITVNNGVLKLGGNATTARDDYFENVDLTLNGGTLNAQNDFLDTIKVNNFVVGNSNSEFVLDADISSKNGSSDSIVADSVVSNGSLYIGPLNIINAMTERQNSSEFTFINKDVNSMIEEVNKHITVDGVTYNVSVDSNKIIIKRDGFSDGFAYAVIDETNAERTYEIGSEDEIVTEWVGGNNNLFGKKFQVLGGSKGKSLIAQNDIDGIILGLYDNNPQQLDITGVTSYQGFSCAIINKGAKVNIKSTKFEYNTAKVSASNDGNGGVIKNIKGIVNISDGTTFEKNRAQTNGGAIFNGVEGTINFQTETDKDINFVENVANGQGNDIFNEGTINIKGNGKINVTGGIAGISGAIISNNGSILNLGGANEKYIGEFVQNSGTTNVTGSFFGGKSEIAGVLNWLTDTDIAEGAMMTFNGGNLNVGNGVNSAKLTIKGDSTLAGASTVEVKNNAELTFAKEAEIGTISGVGTIGVENSVLTFNENSYLSETLKFKSQNSSAILTDTDFSKSDLLLGVITSGENNHLDLSFDNLKTSTDLILSSDGIYKISTNRTTSISGELSISSSAIFENLSTGELSLGGKVTNCGTLNNFGKLVLNGEFENTQNLQNNGVVNANSKLSLEGQIVNNGGDFNVNGELVGSGNFVNDGGKVNLSSDASQFNGSFVQNGGVTHVSLSDLIFGGEKVINSGELKINGGAINYSNTKLGSNATLSHSIDTTVFGKLNNNTIEFIGSGAKASFVSDNLFGNLTLGSVDNGQSNTISIVGNTISLSDTEFLGGTVYEIKNSVLNLIEENPNASVKDYIFDNLQTENSKISFNIQIDRKDDENTISTDTLTVNNIGEQKIALSNVYITGEENGQRGDYKTKKDVLNGDISFSPDSDAAITGGTTSWIYKVTLNGDKTIKMAIENYADNNTLYEMNDTSNKRFFQFSENDDRVYHIKKSLDETKNGTFNVNGFDKEKHILSGVINEATGEKGNFFKVTDTENETVLNIKNITINDAYIDGNGSVLFVDSDKATVSIVNSSIKNNESTKRGGAIYNEAGNLLVENTDFSGNTSEFEGGAIYNSGTTKIVLSNFENNSSNVVGGAIYNSSNLSIISSTIKSGSGKNDFYQTADASTIFGSTKIGEEIIANNIETNISGEGTLTNTGILNLSGNNSGFLGNFEQTSGQTTISGTNALFFGGTNTISGGILNWYLEDSDDLFGINLSLKNNSVLIIGKDENQKSVLKVSSGVIEKSADVLINKNSLLAITGSEITLDENDAWNGSVFVAGGGILNLENLRGNGKVFGDAKGTINLISGNLILNDPENTADDDKSTILESAKVSIENGSNLIISNGKVTLNGKQIDGLFDDSDKWAGTVTLLNNGNLTISEEFDSNGTLTAEGGNLLLVNNAKLSINSGSVISDAVKTEITQDSELVIKGGKVTIGNDDIWKGTISLGADGKGGTLNYNTNQSGTLVASSGSLNLLKDSVLNIKIPSQIKNAVIVDIQKEATVNVNNGAEFNLDSLDKWNGKIAVNGGKLSIQKVDNSSNGGVLQQLGGETIFDKNSNLYISGESYIKGGKTSILGGSILHIDRNVTISADKLTMGGNSILNVMNGTIDTNNIIEMQIDGRNNVTVDLNLSDKVGDTFKISSLNGNGTLNISDFNFVGSTPIDRDIKFQIFDAENISDVEFTSTDKKILTPIGNYILVSQGGGAYIATLSDFNPQTFRGQVSTLSAYNHQLLIHDMLMNHFILPNQRLIDKAATANKYSSTSPLFAPYQTSINDGGLWTKSYVSFETLSMTHGLKVDDVVYGTLIGADLPAINLGQGWKFTPTGYVAYNGGNEKFNGVKITQNGGQGGIMGTVSKKNFIGSMAVYGGGYANDMSVSGNSDSVGNWFVGTAIKTAYNIHATKKFIVQPTAAFSYNLFGSQNWKSDFGSISMNTGTLNGINIAPGVNFIFSQKTWSLYGTVQYMFNINENIDAKAGNVVVDSVGMRRGYVSYGVGLTKTWKEQLNSYLQVSMRNGGRTGVGFQFGLNYSFNSSNKNKFHSSNSVRKTSYNIKPRAKTIRAI